MSTVMMGEEIKVLLVGDYPPPYGGISVQIQALQSRIMEEPGAYCTVLNIGASRHQVVPGCLGASTSWEFFRTLLFYAWNGYVIHIVTNGHNIKSWVCALACSVMGLLNRRQTIIALDSGAMPTFVDGTSGVRRMLIWFTLRFAGRVICRNQQGHEALARVIVRNKVIEVVPGYTPVGVSGMEALSHQVGEFLARHSPVIGTVVAFRPEYGIELLSDAVSQLSVEYPKVGLIILGSGGKQEDYDEIWNRLSGRVLVLRDLPHAQCVAIMRHFQVFARCTFYDGDAISIREAMELGVPVVASDTDSRPEGVTKFAIGDGQQLIGALLQVLSSSNQSGRRSPEPSKPLGAGCSETMLGIYKSLCSSGSA